MATACLLAWARSLTSPANASDAASDGPMNYVGIASVAFFGFFAITMRPAYLALILWLPLVATLLLTRRSSRFRAIPMKRAVVLASLSSIAKRSILFDLELLVIDVENVTGDQFFSASGFDNAVQFDAS